MILYGTNLGTSANGSATVGGVPAQHTYAAPLMPYNGVAQYNVAIPASLAGKGKVDVLVTIAGRSSNAVNVTIK